MRKPSHLCMSFSPRECCSRVLPRVCDEEMARHSNDLISRGIMKQQHQGAGRTTCSVTEDQEAIVLVPDNRLGANGEPLP